MINYKAEILKKIDTFDHLTREQKNSLRDFALSLSEPDWKKFLKHPAAFTLSAVKAKKINREIKAGLDRILAVTETKVKDFIRSNK